MSPPEINVDKLMHQIRQSVARRVAENGRKAMLDENDGGEPAVGQIDGPGLALQPDFQASPTNSYHANDLLKYHGETFVRNAYRAILLREPDSTGAAHHLSSLAAGHLNKIDILASLRYSAEGKQAGVNILGLAWPATIRKIERVPIVGYLLQMMIGLARLPVLLRHQRQHEFYSFSRQDQLVEYLDGVKREVAHNASEVSARATAIEIDVRAQRESVASLEGEINSALSSLRDEIAATAVALRDVEAQLRDAETRTTTLTTQLADTASTFNSRVNEQVSRHGELEVQLRTLTEAKERLVADLGSQEKRLIDVVELAQIQSGLNEAGLDEFYATFEDHFRGEYDEIKDRLRVYLPILQGANVSSDILDIGCGRGEWLQLLREHGMQARGVDHNQIFVDRCREAGLQVVRADAIAYLRGLPDAGLNAVTSFHLVEHLPFKILMTLLDEIGRVLRPGAPLILETPNPENFIVGSHTFYSDPTHRNPIPSATLQFLLETHGFSRIEVMNVRPWEEAKLAGDDELTKRFNEYFYASPDYGIVGWKN